jgi:GGDEF domain-containing protein
VLAVFELVGLRDYRRSFGERASLAVITRCADQITRVMELAGVCYRPREDELCALMTGRPIHHVRAALFAAEHAINAGDEPCVISPCFGAAVLPDEASDPIDLLILADQRLHLRSGTRKPRERPQNTPLRTKPIQHQRPSAPKAA